jgi:hypothetical protein
LTFAAHLKEKVLIQSRGVGRKKESKPPRLRGCLVLYHRGATKERGARAFELKSHKANSPQSGLFSNLFGKSPLDKGFTHQHRASGAAAALLRTT